MYKMINFQVKNKCKRLPSKNYFIYILILGKDANILDFGVEAFCTTQKIFDLL